MKLSLALPLLFSCGMAVAADADFPINEQSFADRIGWLDKAAIIERIGEPSKVVDIPQRDTGEIVASIWHYHYLNTTEDGEYYKTTELDFIGNRVVNVIFSMTDDSEQESTAYLPSECSADC